jgi:phosphatidylglycerophosphate synthase
MTELFPEGLGDKTWFYSIAVLSLFLALEAKINTKNVIKVIGLLCACVGALVYASGVPNFIMWLGIVIFFLSFLSEFVDYCRAKRAGQNRLERRNDK